MPLSIERLHVKHLRDGRKRRFNIIEEHPTHLLIQDQDTGVYWFFDPPLSLQRIIDEQKKERPLVGRVLIGEMQKDTPITLRWMIR